MFGIFAARLKKAKIKRLWLMQVVKCAACAEKLILQKLPRQGLILYAALQKSKPSHRRGKKIAKYIAA